VPPGPHVTQGPAERARPRAALPRVTHWGRVPDQGQPERGPPRARDNAPTELRSPRSPRRAHAIPPLTRTPAPLSGHPRPSARPPPRGSPESAAALRLELPRRGPGTSRRRLPSRVSALGCSRWPPTNLGAAGTAAGINDNGHGHCRDAPAPTAARGGGDCTPLGGGRCALAPPQAPPPRAAPPPLPPGPAARTRRRLAQTQRESLQRGCARGPAPGVAPLARLRSQGQPRKVMEQRGERSGPAGANPPERAALLRRPCGKKSGSKTARVASVAPRRKSGATSVNSRGHQWLRLGRRGGREPAEVLRFTSYFTCPKALPLTSPSFGCRAHSG
jgi:hypothetical protein